jgi:aryl-alcohol dehydrogenase-like predicted oxidoreductase
MSRAQSQASVTLESPYPRLFLELLYFGSETPEEDAFARLDTFAEAGGNLIDTADVCVGGASEQIIGSWFAVSDRTRLNRFARKQDEPQV